MCQRTMPVVRIIVVKQKRNKPPPVHGSQVSLILKSRNATARSETANYLNIHSIGHMADEMEPTSSKFNSLVGHFHFLQPEDKTWDSPTTSNTNTHWPWPGQRVV